MRNLIVNFILAPSVLGTCHTQLYHGLKGSPWASSSTWELVRDAECYFLPGLLTAVINCSHSFLLLAKSKALHAGFHLCDVCITTVANVEIHVVEKNFR